MAENTATDVASDKQKIRNFLSRFIQVELNDADDFFSLRLLNSLFAMQLVVFVEKEFNIQVENEDLDIKNFSSIEAIIRFVGEKNNNLV
ncbi:MAG: acyl carrier protein [Enterobacter roggenkampii]